MPSELLRDVPLHNHLPLFSDNSLCVVFHHVVLPKVFNVFWVDEVFFPGVLVVELLKMVDLIFIFVVTVVSRAHSEIWQLLPLLDFFNPLVTSDHAAVVRIEDLEDFQHGFVLFVGRCVFQRFVIEAVRSADLIGGPRAVVVEVM
jgi:hypothetical protein